MDKRDLMIRAWRVSHIAARHFGGKPSEYIAWALGELWENLR